MLVVILIDAVIIATLATVAARHGLEKALPYFAFFVVLLPEESRLSFAGAFDLYSRRLALATLLVLFFVYRKKDAIRQIPMAELICLQIVWALVSTACSIVLATSVKQLLAQVLEYYVLYYIMLKTVTSEKTIIKVLGALVAGMGVCSIFGLFDVYLNWSILSIFPAELQLTYGGGSALYQEMFDRGVRARSTFPHPIHLGGALAMTIPFAIYLATTARTASRKWLFNGTLFLMFLALYKTSSRGPWIAAAFGLAILLFAADRRMRKRLLGIGAFAALVLVLRPGILDTLVNMYRASMDTNSMMGSSANYRTVLFRTVTSTLNGDLARAAVGFGMGSFREKGLVLELPGIDTHRWFTCDSTWILFAYELGYIGLALMAAVLMKPAAMAVRTFRRLSPSDRYLGLVFFSSLAVFYVVMISVAIYGWGQTGYIMWTVISMSVAYGALKTSNARKPAGPDAAALEPAGEPVGVAANVHSAAYFWDPRE